MIGVNFPNRTRDVVAVDERSVELRQLGAAVHGAADHRVGLGVRMVFHRRNDRRRTDRHFGTQRRPAFHHRPAAVAPATQLVNHLPRFPAVVRDEHIAALGIDAELPRVPQSVGPNLRPRSRPIHEWVVGWNRVWLLDGSSIHIQSQHGTQEIVHRLAGRQSVRRVRPRAVAGGNVQVAVPVEFQATGIMTTRWPCNDDALAVGHRLVRGLAVKRKPRDPRMAAVARMDVTYENVAVLRKRRVRLGIE